MRYATGNDAGAMADINIIPLADVLLVLLIVFMVSAPAVSRTIGLDLPQAAPPDADRPPPPREIVLRIDPAGDTYRDGHLVPDALLVRSLRQAADGGDAAGEPTRVVIDASDAADYQSVARVLAATGEAGLRQVAFARD